MSLEYIVLIAVGIAISLTIVYLLVWSSKESKEGIVDAQVNKIGRDIVDSTEEIYYSGKYSKTTLMLNLPEEVDSIFIEALRELVITYNTMDGEKEAVFFSSIPIVNKLTSIEDINEIVIKSAGFYVLLCETEEDCVLECSLEGDGICPEGCTVDDDADCGEVPEVPLICRVIDVTEESCDGTVVFKMSKEKNAHAEIPSEDNYNYEVCCEADTALTSSCEGADATVLHLAMNTNAHVEKNTGTNYVIAPAENVCLSSGSETEIVVCGYTTFDDYSAEYDACLATISADTNAHVADCITEPYDIIVWCSVEES